MIVAHIIGGLGNQMFMYAAGRAVALRRGVPLKLDLTHFGDYGLRRYELDCLNIDVREAATARELSQLAGFGNIYREPEYFRFDPRVLDLPAPLYLRGYFQSFKYLAGIETVLRREFTLKALPTAQDQAVLDEIAATNAVMLHVRRGDYVSNPETLSVHGVCSLDYYRAALAEIRRRVQDPTIFVFSDDIYWVQKHLRPDVPTIYVGHNRGDESFRDLRLMAACRHHIIANSSFSWWGAWLAAHPQQVVIAPDRWMTRLYNLDDLLPPGWTRLPRD